MPRLRCALIGLGHNARNLMNEIAWIPALRRKIELVAGFDPDQRARERAASQARTCRVKDFGVHETFDSLLSARSFDGVLINSPPHEHAVQSVIALESGLHVYAEVPMALTVADIEKVIAAEASSRKCFQHGENYCFFTEVLYAGHLAHEGRLGVPVAVTAEFQIDEDPRKEWRSRLDPLMYGHAIAPAQVALGGIDDPARFVEAISFASRASVEAESRAFSPAFTYHEALFRAEGGAIARCVNAYTSTRPHGRFRFEVIGSKATFECTRPGGSASLSSKMSTVPNKRLKWTRRIGQIALARVIKPSIGNFHGARTRVLVNWADAIGHGRKPQLNATVAANACAAGIAASESARQGKGIPVKVFS